MNLVVYAICLLFYVSNERSRILRARSVAVVVVGVVVVVACVFFDKRK